MARHGTAQQSGGGGGGGASSQGHVLWDARSVLAIGRMLHAWCMAARYMLQVACCAVYVVKEGHSMVFNESQCVFTYGIAVLNGLTVGSDPSLHSKPGCNTARHFAVRPERALEYRTGVCVCVCARARARGRGDAHWIFDYGVDCCNVIDRAEAESCDPSVEMITHRVGRARAISVKLVAWGCRRPFAILMIGGPSSTSGKWRRWLQLGIRTMAHHHQPRHARLGRR